MYWPVKYYYKIVLLFKNHLTVGHANKRNDIKWFYIMLIAALK